MGLTDVALRRRTEPSEGVFIAEGTPLITRALAAGCRPMTMVMIPERVERMDVAAAARGFGHQGGSIHVVDAEDLRETAGFHAHRGVMASFARPRLPSVAEVARGARTLAVFEGIVDHTNVGAAIRSAAALGVDGIILDPRCADPYYRRALRTSMGTVFSLRIARCASWPAGIHQLRELGFRVLAMTPDGAGTDLGAIQLSATGKVALVLGSEGRGLSRAALDAADSWVRIPMGGDVDSLNVAATAAVGFWALRARRLANDAVGRAQSPATTGHEAP